MKNTMWFVGLDLLVLTSVVVITDQLTKMAVRSIEFGQLNYGGILGLFPGKWWSLGMSGVVVVVVGIGVKSQRILERSGWVVIGAAGFSNLIDRWRLGGVWDWIYYPVIEVVGNMADVWLVVGVGMLVLDQFLINRR